MNDKPIHMMSIEELREDFQEACNDYGKVKAEGTEGRNAWSLVWIDRRINDLKRAIKKHDDRLIFLQQQ